MRARTKVNYEPLKEDVLSGKMTPHEALDRCDYRTHEFFTAKDGSDPILNRAVNENRPTELVIDLVTVMKNFVQVKWRRDILYGEDGVSIISGLSTEFERDKKLVEVFSPLLKGLEEYDKARALEKARREALNKLSSYEPWFAPGDEAFVNEIKMELLNGEISLKEAMRKAENSIFELLKAEKAIAESSVFELVESEEAISRRRGDLRRSKPIFFVTVVNQNYDVLTGKLVALAQKLDSGMQHAILTQELWSSEERLIDYVMDPKRGVSEETKKQFGEWRDALRERMKKENSLFWRDL